MVSCHAHSCIPVSLLMVVVLVDTTAAVGGSAVVVTTRVTGCQILLLPQIPNLIQQIAHTGVMIGRSVHIRASMTIPAIMPATEVATHMITIVCNENCIAAMICNENCIKIINAQNSIM